MGAARVTDIDRSGDMPEGLRIALRTAQDRKLAAVPDPDDPWGSTPADDSFDPSPLEPPSEDPGSADDDEPNTWLPVDLGPYLRGDVEPPQPPALGVTRTDGVQLIYAGREHALIGETESGKTWLALACVIAELMRGRRVVYIHYEESSPESTIERLRLMGIGDDLLRPPLFRFVAPQQPIARKDRRALLALPPALVIHDGVNEAMALHGAEQGVDGASAFRRRLVTPFLRVGAATLACDHVPMSRDNTRRDAYGTVHKGNALDGARIALENRSPFGRGLRGVSNVYVTKDRPGHLRVRGRPTKVPGKTYMGTLVGDDSDPFNPFSLMFYAPRDDDQPDQDSPADRLAEDVWEVIAAQPERTVNSLRQLYAQMRKASKQFTESAARDAVEDLLADGRLVQVQARGKGASTGYQAVQTAADGERP
jgi:hypothetical protein